MAESMVYFAAQHINSVMAEEMKALPTEVGSAVDALRKELEGVVVDPGNNQPRLANDDRTRGWMIELRRIAHDAEDVVDTLVPIFNIDCAPFTSLVSFFNMPRSRKASKELRKLRERTQGIKDRLKNHESSEGSSENSPKYRSTPAIQGYRQADDDFVVGIDDDVDKLIKKLIEKSEEDRDPNVVNIVGMGGSGKSTLARTIYNHQQVKKHFDYQAWIQLPQDWRWDDHSDEQLLVTELLRHFDGSRMVNKLLRVAFQVIGDHNKTNDTGNKSNEDLKVMKARLQKLTSTKRCLFVLDDVWHSTSLHKILNTLSIHNCDRDDPSCTRTGSNQHDPSSAWNTNDCTSSNTKILITSRHRLESPKGLRWEFHDTHLLNDEDSWKLFNKVSSGNNGNELAEEYRGLAMEMLQTCKGLPLAIVALGRLLKQKDTIQEWERVLSLLQREGGQSLYGPVKDILALSYDELPYYLKSCFLYLGLLAKDSTISAGTLIRMWIAEGFVKCATPESEETLEDKARRLLQELVNHTMVQVVDTSYTGKVKTLRVHAIMRDLCILKAREQDFLTFFSSDIDHGTGAHSRRAAINLSNCSTFPINNTSLRSLMLFGQSGTGIGVSGEHGSKVSQQGKLDLVLISEKFKLLRVLDINGIKISSGTMPKEIGSLIHLRYLRVRATNIRELPKTIGKLRKLLTLDYWDVSSDIEIRLPNVLWKLERLRHLFLPGELMSNIEREDLRLDSLENLQILWGIKGGDWMIKEMKTLSSTITKLGIQGISSPKQLKSVFKCEAIKKNNLYALALDWLDFSFESLNLLLLGNKLKKLRLTGKAPDTSKKLEFPSSLEKLELHYTHLERRETMDALGELPSLRYLRLAKDSFIGSEWIIGKGAFPCLEELILSNLGKLEDWKMEEGVMPCLKRLSIVACSNLKQMPEGLKHVTSLQTLKIERMPTLFNNRLRRRSSEKGSCGEDYHIVQHIPNVKIRDSSASL